MSNHDGGRSTIERALEIASRGSATSIRDVREQLKKEQYDGIDQATAGMSIKAQLNKLIAGRIQAARDL